MQPRKEKQLKKKTKKHEPKREQAYEKTDNEMGKETTQTVLQSNYDSTIPKSFQKINRGGLP
jgi:hypothetical protein